MQSFSRIQKIRRWCHIAPSAVLWLLVAIPAVHAQAADQWQVQTDNTGHVRVQRLAAPGGDSAFAAAYRVVSDRDFESFQLVLQRPPAMAIDDLEVVVPVLSSHQTVTIGLRLVVPGQTDPRTGRPLVTSLFGDAISPKAETQSLTIRPTAASLAARARALRAEINRSDISLDGAYVDAVILNVEVHRGVGELRLGPCRYGPIVCPSRLVSPEESVKQQPPQTRGRFVVRRGKTTLDGRPFFPRFLPDHGESTALIRQLQVNMAWVSDIANEPRLRELIDSGLVVMATPPHPQFDPADFSTPLDGLPPLDRTAALPDAWYLGTAIDRAQLPHLMAWAKEVRSADRQMQRPLFADLSESEGVASRLVDSVGLSPYAMERLIPFGLARNRSFVRQNSSAQLAMSWEWIQTEHGASLNGWRRRMNLKDATVEPEQILMQLAAALSAGSRGVGFWKTRQLNPEDSADLELLTAIELAGVFIEILEPVLLQGKVDGHVRLTVKDGRQNDGNGKDLLQTFLGTRSAGSPDYDGTPDEPDAAVISLQGTSLIVIGMWDSLSQYVPQQLHESAAKLVVSATETASAWQITPTSVRGFRRQPVPGGLLLNLTDCDTMCLILVTADGELRNEVLARVQKHAGRAARLFVQMARLKFNRVQRQSAELNALTNAPSQVAERLQAADEQIAAAEDALLRRSYSEAERASRAGMRILRDVQNSYWLQAVRRLSTPTASPHTASFSTLADHWKMMAYASRIPPSENLLPSGSFEQQDGLRSGSWKPVVTRPKEFHAAADIVTSRAERNHILRMRSWSRNVTSTNGRSSLALLVQCPEISVQAGDILEISLRARVGPGIPQTHKRPLAVFDDDLGPELAAAPLLGPSWRNIRVYRTASRSGTFRFWLGLRNPAEVFVDDVQVVRKSPAESGASDSNTRPVSFSVSP